MSQDKTVAQGAIAAALDAIANLCINHVITFLLTFLPWPLPLLIGVFLIACRRVATYLCDTASSFLSSLRSTFPSLGKQGGSVTLAALLTLTSEYFQFISKMPSLSLQPPISSSLLLFNCPLENATHCCREHTNTAIFATHLFGHPNSFDFSPYSSVLSIFTLPMPYLAEPMHSFTVPPSTIISNNC